MPFNSNMYLFKSKLSIVYRETHVKAKKMIAIINYQELKLQLCS